MCGGVLSRSQDPKQLVFHGAELGAELSPSDAWASKVVGSLEAVCTKWRRGRKTHKDLTSPSSHSAALREAQLTPSSPTNVIPVLGQSPRMQSLRQGFRYMRLLEEGLEK